MKTPAEYYNEGIRLKQQGEFERSAQCHLKVIELDPETDVPEAWHNAGAALQRINRNTDAIPYLEKAIYYYDLAIEETPSRKDYLLFWKSCVYALLADKENMLVVLSECLSLNDSYAIEADYEEDFNNYVNDADFRNLIDPAIKTIDLLVFRGKPLSQEDVTANQLAIRDNFIKRLLEINWIKEPLTDLFGTSSVSPQAMMQYTANQNFDMHISLHLDTNLLFYELIDKQDPTFELMFRFYYEEDNLDMGAVTEHIKRHQDQITEDSWEIHIKAFIPLFKEVQLQAVDGTIVQLENLS